MRPLELAQSANVNQSADIGEDVRSRRERLRMTISELAAEAGISRDTLSDLEVGAKTPQPKTVGKVLDALARVETEVYGATGVDVPAATPTTAEQMEIVVEGDLGVRVTVKGPISDREALVDSVAKIMRSIRESSPDTTGS
jgi:transcriptional regulator with XRE-family HTH domain